MYLGAAFIVWVYVLFLWAFTVCFSTLLTRFNFSTLAIYVSGDGLAPFKPV